MTGGKESRVYGIEVKTGKIRYECTMAGCFSPTGEDVETGVNICLYLLRCLRERFSIFDDFGKGFVQTKTLTTHMTSKNV